jgi:hypothetical protein
VAGPRVACSLSVRLSDDDCIALTELYFMVAGCSKTGRPGLVKVSPSKWDEKMGDNLYQIKS